MKKLVVNTCFANDTNTNDTNTLEGNIVQLYPRIASLFTPLTILRNNSSVKKRKLL